MKIEQEQNLQNPEFMPPPPVSNMSDSAANDTFKQDLLQSAMVLDQTGQMQDKHMPIHHQQQNPNQMMMLQQQLDHEQMMMHHQQTQEHLIMRQQQQSQEEMMMQQQSIEDQINLNPPMEVTAPVAQDIHDDLAISDSDDEDGKGHPPPLAMKTQENEDENGGLWF